MTNVNFTACPAWLEQLSKPIGDLSPSERAKLEAHVASCPACRLVQFDYAMISDLIRSLSGPDFPLGLPPRLQQLLDEERASADSTAISGILPAVASRTMRASSAERAEPKKPTLAVSSTASPVGANTQNSSMGEHPSTISQEQVSQEIRVKLTPSALLQAARYLASQSDLRWFVALTIGPFVNFCCKIYRRFGIPAYVDRVLVCRDCHQLFLFTTEEQRFYQQKNLIQQPGRCPACRAVRRAKREDKPPAAQETQICHRETQKT